MQQQSNRVHKMYCINVQFTGPQCVVGRTGLCSVSRPRQHSIGYMGDGCYSVVLLVTAKNTTISRTVHCMCQK